MRSEPRTFLAHYRSVDDAVELHRKYFDPLIPTFEAVPAHEQESLWKDIAAVFGRQPGD